MHRLKQIIREAAIKRWAPSVYSPNELPPPLFKLLNGRKNLAYMDIGAFNGDFFFNLTEVVEFQSAFLVEPIPRLADALRRRFPDNVVIQAAIGAENKNIEFNEYIDAPYMSSILDLRADAVEHAALANGNVLIQQVRQRTLDDLAEEYKIEKLDLLKIDAQGAELTILKGGASLLSRTAAVWVEVSFIKLYEQSCLFHEVHDALYNMGFQLCELTPGWRSPSGELAQADGLFRKRLAPD